MKPHFLHYTYIQFHTTFYDLCLLKFLFENVKDFMKQFSALKIRSLTYLSCGIFDSVTFNKIAIFFISFYVLLLSFEGVINMKYAMKHLLSTQIRGNFVNYVTLIYREFEPLIKLFSHFFLKNLLLPHLAWTSLHREWRNLRTTLRVFKEFSFFALKI